VCIEDFQAVIYLLSLNKIQVLTDFGLTTTQAKAYLCLNIMGQSSAGNLAKYSKISRQDIYRVLDELFEIGLIEKVVKMPFEFKAIPIDKCVALLVKQRNRKTVELRKTAIENLSLNEYLTKQGLENRSSKVLVLNQESVLFKVEELFSSTYESIFVFSPPQKLYPWIFDHAMLLRKALKRRVQIKLLTSDNNSKLPPFFKVSHSNLELKFVEKIPRVSFGLYDNKNVVFEFEADNGYLESQVLFSDNPCLIQLALECFTCHWSQARTYCLSLMAHIA
jgi:sugar-specific transcriptional regulator TrmB